MHPKFVERLVNIYYDKQEKEGERVAMAWFRGLDKEAKAHILAHIRRRNKQ